MSRAIITYAAGAHEELLDVALPTYRAFADRHGYDLVVGKNLMLGKMVGMPPAWNKIPLLLDTLNSYDEVVWFDCDLVVVDASEGPTMRVGAFHAMVRHFEDNSEVPNSGVWRLSRIDGGGLYAEDLLHRMLDLEVFADHGWWEQAALLTLMGYCVPPQGHHFPDTQCKCVRQTMWYDKCEFMRLAWNSHPNYRAGKPRIVHCSYPDMPRRLEVMRALVKDPRYDYPKFERERFDVSRKEEVE